MTKEQLINYINLYCEENGLVNELSYMSPVITHYITHHNNIEITGKFKINDPSTDNPRLLYITVLRQGNILAAQDGYGVAFHINPNKNKYNLYVVDNNILLDNTYFDKIVSTHQINAFRKAGISHIENNKEYYFRMKISENWAISFGYALTEEEIPTSEIPSSTSNKGFISSGALVDGPLGLGIKRPTTEYINKTLTDQNLYSGTGTHFGFGVYDSQQAIFEVSNIKVRRLIKTNPIQIFQFKDIGYDAGLTGENNDLLTKRLKINYVGFGGINDIYGNVIASGVDLFILKLYNHSEGNYPVLNNGVWEFPNLNYLPDINNPTLESLPSQVQGIVQWEYLGSVNAHKNSVISEKSKSFITKDEGRFYFNRNSGSFIIAAAKNFSNVSNADFESGNISTDLIELTPYYEGTITDTDVVDIWIDPLNNLETDISEEIVLTAGSSFITPLPNLKYPVFLIESIYNPDDENKTNLLDYDTISDTGISTYADGDKSGYFYSTRDIMNLISGSDRQGLNVVVKYKHCRSAAMAIEEFANNSRYRIPGRDVLVRCLTPTLFKINSLFYRGPITPEYMKQQVKAYINNLGVTKELVLSDFISFLYSLGVTYLNVATMDISIIAFDYRNYFYKSEKLIDSYTLHSHLTRWYTDLDFLNILKVS